MHTPDRVAFTIGSFSVYWYGVLIACAVLISVLYCAYYMKKKNFPEDAIYNVALWCIPLAIVFARLYYVIFSFSYYKNDLLSIFYIWEGGLAIYGAVIGGALGVYIACRRHHYKFLEVADIIAPVLALSQAIGRWGNFFNQEAYGQPVYLAERQFFPYAVYIGNPGVGATQHWFQATFFYESMACLAIALILHFIIRKKAKLPGTVFFSYLILYGLERAFVEGLRSDSLYLGNLRISQVLSIILIVAGAALIFMRWYNSRISEVEVDPSLALGIEPLAEDEEEPAEEDSDMEEDGTDTEDEEFPSEESDEGEESSDGTEDENEEDLPEEEEDAAPGEDPADDTDIPEETDDPDPEDEPDSKEE